MKMIYFNKWPLRAMWCGGGKPAKEVQFSRGQLLENKVGPGRESWVVGPSKVFLLREGFLKGRKGAQKTANDLSQILCPFFTPHIFSIGFISIHRKYRMYSSSSVNTLGLGMVCFVVFFSSPHHRYAWLGGTHTETNVASGTSATVSKGQGQQGVTPLSLRLAWVIELFPSLLPLLLSNTPALFLILPSTPAQTKTKKQTHGGPILRRCKSGGPWIPFFQFNRLHFLIIPLSLTVQLNNKGLFCCYPMCALVVEFVFVWST